MRGGEVEERGKGGEGEGKSEEERGGVDLQFQSDSLAFVNRYNYPFSVSSRSL